MITATQTHIHCTDKKGTGGFTSLLNSTIRDSSLSLKASGLLVRMLSLPKHWIFNLKHLASITASGVRATWSAMKELQEKGYVKKYPLRDERGRITRWVTEVFESPNLDGLTLLSSLQKPRSRGSTSRKQQTIKRNEVTNTQSEKENIPPLTPQISVATREEKGRGDEITENLEPEEEAANEKVISRQETVNISGVKLKFEVEESQQEPEKPSVDKSSAAPCKEIKQKVDFEDVLMSVAHLKARMQRLGVVPQSEKGKEELAATIQSCDPSQLEACLNHIEEPKNRIRHPFRYFVSQASSFPAENLGMILPLKTAKDFEVEKSAMPDFVREMMDSVKQKNLQQKEELRRKRLSNLSGE